VRKSTQKVVASLENTLEQQELQIIQESIIQHVQQDDWYRAEITKIKTNGAAEKKSQQEIQANIEAYNMQIKKQLLPMFVMEMQAGNIVLKRN
jgi:hypothetical protein